MTSSSFDLTGKRFLVTGANTGIGQGISLAIGRAGGAVIGVGRSPMAETAVALLSSDTDRRCSIIRAAREEWRARFTIERYQSQLMEAVEAAAR